ncbi:MAG: hypothetical protein ACLFVJ_09540 [Persicimonas sp.]
MSASAILRHEEIFERHLLGLLGGGFLGGIVVSILELVVGREVEALGALGFAAVVGLVINGLDPREDTALVRLILALIGGVLMGGIAAAALPLASIWGAAVGGAFIGAALTFDRPQSRARKASTWALFGAAMAGGVFTSATLFETGLLAPIEGTFLSHALTGTTWGLFLAVAAGASDLEFDDEEIAGRLDEAISRHSEVVRDYLESAKELYHQVLRECSRAEQDDTRHRAREIAADTVGALLALAERFDDLGRTIDEKGGRRLERRIERLEGRLDDTEDPALAAEIEQASLEAYQQLEMRQRVQLACTRLESRLQRSVTTLEKLHLTLVQHATSASTDPGLSESLSSLEQLAQEVQLKSLSVDELCEMRQEEQARAAVAHTPTPTEGADGALDVSVERADAHPSTDAGSIGADSMRSGAIEDAAHARKEESAHEPTETSERDYEQVVSEYDASC